MVIEVALQVSETLSPSICRWTSLFEKLILWPEWPKRSIGESPLTGCCLSRFLWKSVQFNCVFIWSNLMDRHTPGIDQQGVKGRKRKLNSSSFQRRKKYRTKAVNCTRLPITWVECNTLEINSKTNQNVCNCFWHWDVALPGKAYCDTAGVLLEISNREALSKRSNSLRGSCVY